MLIEIVNAFETGNSILWEKLDFGEFVLVGISIFVLAAGIFSIVFILWWWLLLILSWGKDDKIKPAINTIRYAVIGIVVTVFTIFFFPMFGRLLGLDVEQYAKPKRIFEKIEEIGNKLFWNGNDYVWVDGSIQSIDEFPADFSDL